MRAQWIGVLGSQHLHLSRTAPITRAHIATLIAHQKCRYSTGDYNSRLWGTPLGQQSEKNSEESSSQLSIEDRRLLGRARLHGIQSLEQLRFEADLGHSDHVGSRFLDNPARRQDLDLWLFLLEVNRQHRGLNGVKATWKGLIYRGPKVELDTNNANARDLIDAFIYAGITADLHFLKDVVRQCISRGYFVTDLFVAVVGGLLRYRPERAPAMVSSLAASCYQGREDLLQVFRAACESTQPLALKSFQGVLDQLSPTDVYHDTIPHLWELDKVAEAFSLHQYLLTKRDRPKAFTVLLPFIGYLAHTGQPLEPFLHDLNAAGIDYQRQTSRIYRRELKLREVQHLLENAKESKDFSPKSVAPEPHSKLEDNTIARVLATTTFSFDFLINAVRMFGAVEFGPLAVRQMILTCPDLPTLDARFERLHELEIDTGSSDFIIIVQRLRSSRSWELLQLMAKSDMHHDEFANRDLQRRLLNQYLSQGSWSDLTRTLIILNEGHTDRSAQENSTSRLLRSAAICHDWRLVLQIVTSLHRNDHRINSKILKQVIDMLLPRSDTLRSGFHSTFHGIPSFNVPSFLIGILQQLLATRTNVSTSHWLRPLMSLAHHDRVDDIHTLSLFLADHYTSPRRNPTSDCDLNKLFSPSFQRALVAWDFTTSKWQHTLAPKTPSTVTAARSPSNSIKTIGPFVSPFFNKSNDDPINTTSKHSGEDEPWLHGARLLKILRDKYNVSIFLPDLEKEYLLRIKRMATAEGSWKVVSNKRAARQAGYSYQDFVDGWANLWYPSSSITNEHIDNTNTSGRRDGPGTANGSLVEGAALAKTDTGSKEGETFKHPAATSSPERLGEELSKFLLELQTGKFAEMQQRRRNNSSDGTSGGRRKRSRYLTGPAL